MAGKMTPRVWRYRYEVALFGVWLMDHWGCPLAAHHYAVEVMAMEANPDGK